MSDRVRVPKYSRVTHVLRDPKGEFRGLQYSDNRRLYYNLNNPPHDLENEAVLKEYSRYKDSIKDDHDRRILNRAMGEGRSGVLKMMGAFASPLAGVAGMNAIGASGLGAVASGASRSAAGHIGRAAVSGISRSAPQAARVAFSNPEVAVNGAGQLVMTSAPAIEASQYLAPGLAVGGFGLAGLSELGRRDKSITQSPIYLSNDTTGILPPVGSSGLRAAEGQSQVVDTTTTQASPQDTTRRNQPQTPEDPEKKRRGFFRRVGRGIKNTGRFGWNVTKYGIIPGAGVNAYFGFSNRLTSNNPSVNKPSDRGYADSIKKERETFRKFIKN